MDTILGKCANLIYKDRVAYSANGVLEWVTLQLVPVTV